MIVLDTTVLVYAVGGDHPLREPCRVIVAAAGELQATTTVEVIQEFAHVAARRRPRGDVADYADRYATAFAPLLQPDGDDLREGLGFFRLGTTMGAFDCVLAATARRREARCLVSADTAFAGIPGLRVVDPADAAAVAHLLHA